MREGDELWPRGRLLSAWEGLRTRLLRARDGKGPRTAELARLYEGGRLATRRAGLAEGPALREGRLRRGLWRAYKGTRVLTEREVAQKARWAARVEITEVLGRMAEMGAVERAARVNAKGRGVTEWRRVERGVLWPPDYGLVRRVVEELEAGLGIRFVEDGVMLMGEYCVTGVGSGAF
jgi:hypothetical protein